MDLPASYYGELDQKNPVIVCFKRDIRSFTAFMKQSSSQDNTSYAKGIQMLMEIWRKYNHRLPSSFYWEHMLQVADFLFGLKLYQLALWQGYGHHLLQFSTVMITDITDISHFMASFFPGGFNDDQATMNLKIRSMQGCALCIFEEEKKLHTLSQRGLNKLLLVLNFIRIMMQAFQKHKDLYNYIYDGSAHIYNICRYLMTMKCGAQALEYLLWASISLERSIALIGAKYLPLSVTLYCAVCHCYYDNHGGPQAEEFARRALRKIHEIAKREEQKKEPATKDIQRVFKEASVKLGAMIFKRAVFESRRRRPNSMLRRTLKDVPKGQWPCTPTERLLTKLFHCNPGHFWGILEALRDSTADPLQMRMSVNPQRKEVVLELLSAGIRVLSGAAGCGNQNNDAPHFSIIALTPTSDLLDLAITGDDKVPILSAVRFIKLLFQYQQLEAFTEFTREMQQILSDIEGHAFRKAERELTLLSLMLSTQKSLSTEDNINQGQKSSRDDISALVDTLHTTVYGSPTEAQPDKDLVFNIVLFLWYKVKNLILRDQQKGAILNKLVWCLSLLCDAAFACDTVTIDCVTMIEMIYSLRILLENEPSCFYQPQGQATSENHHKSEKTSDLALLLMIREVVERGVAALEKHVATLPPPQDFSALTDTAFMQKSGAVSSSTTPSKQENTEEEEIMGSNEETEAMVNYENKDDTYTESSTMFLMAKNLHFELHIIYNKVSLKLLQLNKVTELQLLDRIKKNKVSKALFLVQKALLVYEEQQSDHSKITTNLLQEAYVLVEKAGIEEKKLYKQATNSLTEKQHRRMKEDENFPPPPILLSRTDRSLTFSPGLYNIEGDVCWYRLCGCVAEGHTRKVSLLDCALPGTGNMVPAVSGKCVLKVEGLEPNQKFVFAVAAYDKQGKLMGKSIGAPTRPLLASMPVPLLYTWAHLAQVAFQTKNYTTAKRACGELWSHFTSPVSESDSGEDRLATTTGLFQETLQRCSPQLCKMFLTSIFIETEINIQQGSLFWDSFSARGPFIWEKEARLAECERMLVAIDLAMYLNDGNAAVEASVSCYGLLAPIISHQITCSSIVQILKKCLVVLEENSGFLKQKWAEKTSKSLIHMIACITYYLSKTLRILGEHQKAPLVLEAGSRLLKDVYDAQCMTQEPTAFRGKTKTVLHLTVLHEKNMRKTTSDTDFTTFTDNFMQLTNFEDPSQLYDLMSHCRLTDAFQIVKKLKRKPHFAELASLLLQRGIEEGFPDLVVTWGEVILKIFSWRHEGRGQYPERTEGNSGSVQNRNSPPHDLRKRLGKKLLQGVKTDRAMHLVGKLLNMMTSVVQRHKKKLQFRRMSSEENQWKSQLNYSLAQAHLALLYQSFDKLQGGVQQHRQNYSKPELYFESNNSLSADRDESLMTTQTDLEKNDANRLDDNVTKENAVVEEDQSKAAELSHGLLLDYLTKVALHLRRAAVFAHRGGDWTTLQFVCQNVWDQSSRISVLLRELSEFQNKAPFTVEQLQNIFTPLFVLATDLIMDMLENLGLWSLYDKDTTDMELECSLHFSAPLDDRSQVDLRWIRTFLLHTLERLHENGKWETLVHFALLFNSYTRERYAVTVTPLLVNAQKKLLERISCFGGPTAPQPHHIKTWKATGKEVTCRTYAGCQLLCDWKPETVDRKDVASEEVLDLKGSEIQLAMSRVCVPLDVENTLRCYHQALEKKPQSLQVFQQNRFLLRQLLANVQPWFSQKNQSRGPSPSESCSDEIPMVRCTPSIQQCKRTEEDFSPVNDKCGLPIGSDQLQTITAAYLTSIKYFKANGPESLRVLGLHEMGDLNFYNGKLQVAHSCWSKAVDCALQSSSVVEKWDGIPNGSESMEQTVKRAGIWGCLQAAVLTAKLAQYSMRSDISQRSRCCLLSAHLFKCVLSCSMAHPKSDLQYASYNVGEEVFPGVDLFSEPLRLDVGSTATSLNFICNWLFITGYHTTVLPMVAFYLYVVGTVCRSVEHTVDGKILKIRVLTQLHLFTDAVREAVELTVGYGVILPHGYYISGAVPVSKFYSDKCLLDNVKALQELVDCDFTPEVCTLYGPTLCVRAKLAQAQLLLAIANTTCCCCSVPDSAEGESVGKRCLETSKITEPGSQNIGFNSEKEEPTILTHSSEKEKQSTQCVKSLLLEGSSSLLEFISQQLQSDVCGEMEKLELTIESHLLKSRLYLQHGKPAQSIEETKSSLFLLQTSPLILGRSPKSQNPSKDTTHAMTDTKECGGLNKIQTDCPREVCAGERVGLSLWLRCRLALSHSLNASIASDSDPSPEKLMVEAAQTAQRGINECKTWGDPDTQAQFMLKSAELESKRGRSQDCLESLQEVVRLLSGRPFSPPDSVITLAKATLLISDLRTERSPTLLQLTHTLLKKQLSAFGQSVDENTSITPTKPNFYLPHFELLLQTSRRIDSIQTDPNGTSTNVQPASADE
ncbi:cilia- and flagella-associated protein 54 isoform X3 [Gouania willdenowi]|uniref:cilia- and flagella-associated protein 54 isoform X3 n=1 Tax=Gouania willdenowi TaxID=441366 RepID=UPI00105429EB|nr:cilia- and flagella-associated protein 54 isoform X3 [Gouania willdenowi]